MTKALSCLVVSLLILISCKPKRKEVNQEVAQKIENVQNQIINGYTNKTSYYSGEKCEIYINAELRSTEKLAITSVFGDTVDEISAVVFPQDTNELAPWELGFGYKVTTRYKIPNLSSGFYFIAGKIPFVIKSKGSKQITCVYPSNTINAYNNTGGKCLYPYLSTNETESNIVSFLRPMPFGDVYSSAVFYRWFLVKYGSQVNYICDKDLDSLHLFEHSTILVIPGHNEYWTRKARLNFDEFIDKGGHSVVLSGNTMWWQVRYDHSANSMICYKDYGEDPIPYSLYKTDKWTDKRLDLPIIQSIGANFDFGGYGKKKDNGYDGYKIVDEKSPLLEGTKLKNGDVLQLPTTEFDGAPLQGFTSDSIPLINNEKLNFHRVNLIGYDLGTRGGRQTVGTFIVFQRNETSGITINCCSTNWCSENSFAGKDSATFKRITSNMIDKLLQQDSIF